MRHVPALSYDWLTPYFDFLVSAFGFGPRQWRRIVELLDLQEGERLREVGSGSGGTLLAVKRRFPGVAVTGVDADRKILTIARRKAAEANVPLHLVEGGDQQLPFGGQSFDAVVSTLIFHHLPTDVKQRALDEVGRVLPSHLLRPQATNRVSMARPG